MTTKKPRSPIYSLDRDGRDIVLVPLSNHPKPAKLFKEDFIRLEEAGLGLAWTYNPNGTGGQFYVRAYVSGVRGDLVTVARLIAGAGDGLRVQYRDGDRLNLRADNLYVSLGYAKGKATIPADEAPSQATFTHDPDGAAVALVPVDGMFSPARVFADDYATITTHGAKHPWTVSEGSPCERRVVDADGRAIANIIANEAPDDTVAHMDASIFNLRRDNLYTIHSGK